MKPEIHPKYAEIQITCLACNTKFAVGSTRKDLVEAAYTLGATPGGVVRRALGEVSPDQ